MKKLFIVSLFLLFAITASGQVNFSLGANTGYSLNSSTYKISDSLQLNGWDYVVTAAFFIDITYARLTAFYGRSIGCTVETKSGTTSLSTPNPDGYYKNTINIELLGKFPFNFDNLKVWPALGLMYSILLSADNNGDSVADDLSNTDQNDLYICGGCGLDAFLSDQFYFTINLLFNWNFMPLTTKNMTLGEKQAMWEWHISSTAGIGFKF